MSTKMDDEKLRCSFCGKAQDEVKKLIAGPHVYICNECIRLCQDILKDELNNTDEEFELKDDLPTPAVI